MTLDVKVYDPNAVSIVFGAVAIDSGYGEDEFLSIAQEEQDFTVVKSTDGTITRSLRLDRYTECTIQLIQGSDWNSALAAINALDRSAPNGAGVGAFLARNRYGLALYGMSRAWIVGPPKDVVFARGAKGRSWIIGGQMDQRFDGGAASL
jgi:hypothetical protein